MTKEGPGESRGLQYAERAKGHLTSVMFHTPQSYSRESRSGAEFIIGNNANQSAESPGVFLFMA